MTDTELSEVLNECENRMEDNKITLKQLKQLNNVVSDQRIDIIRRYCNDFSERLAWVTENLLKESGVKHD